MDSPDGEVVMEDSKPELRQHLPIWLRARGTVLVTGLGLGCVVRGLQVKPDIERIDVIEIDREILDKIGPEFENDARVNLIHGDALTHPVGKQHWQFAWHDLWTDKTESGEHVQILHAQVMVRFRDVCAAQGAWRLPRFIRKIAPRVVGVY